MGTVPCKVEWKKHDVERDEASTKCGGDFRCLTYPRCEAFTKSGSWFQLKWPQSWVVVNIVRRELLPVVLACAVWGRSWRGKTIRCNCDNAAVVAILKSGTCKDSLTMHLARSLFFFLAEFNISIYAVYLPGEQNMAVDSLSRDDLPSLFQVVPTAS